MEDARLLELRLQRLQRRNRISAVGLVAAALLLCCAVASAGWQPPETLDELRVRKLSIVDESGSDRIGLLVDRVDEMALSPRMAFFKKDGAEVLHMSSRPRGDLHSVIELRDKAGRMCESLFVHPDDYALHWIINRNAVRVVERGGR